MAKKLIRVVRVYDDGSAEYISGGDLERWEGAAISTAMLYQAHFGKTGFEDVIWQLVEKGANE